MPKQRYKGFRPFQYQRDVIDELINANGTGKIVVAKSQRQRGKTTMIANVLLYFSFNFKATKNYCVSPTFAQAKEVYKTITNAIGKSPAVKSANASDLIITLINGSTISFKSAQQGEALRGYTCTGILCIDECAYISDEVYNIIRPWTDFHKAVTLMVSTPFMQDGFYWRYYNYGKEHTHNTTTIDWCDEKYKEEMLQIMPAERLEEYRQMLPKTVYLTEYLGEWLTADGSVFTDFKPCIRKNSIQPNDKLYVGIDWGNGGNNDDTAISIINQNGQQVFLAYWNNLSTNRQMDKLERILKPIEHQIVSIEPEQNSIGTPYTDLLKNRLQISTQSKVHGFTTTNVSKAEIVSNLQVAFEQGTIQILDDEKQTRELAIYTADYNPKTKNVSYNAPLGMHDDLCIALMLSWDALKQSRIIGNYIVR